MKKSVAAVLLVVLFILGADTKIDLKSRAKNPDFRAMTGTFPSQTGTSLPVTCAAGQQYFLTATTAGQNIYGCVAANTWNLEGGTGGGGGGSTVAAGNGILVTGSGTQTVAVDPNYVPVLSIANDMVGSNLINITTLTASMTNETGTGTTINRAVIQTGNPATAKIATTGTTYGIIGICISGCSNSGTARIAISGFANLDSDGATTVGNCIIESLTTGGKGHDSGTAALSGCPAGSFGIWQSTNGGAGSYSVLVAPSIGAAGAGGSGMVPVVAGLPIVTYSAVKYLLPHLTTVTSADALSYTWLNQGSATETIANNVVTLNIVAADGNHARIRKKNIPGGANTIVAAFNVIGAGDGGQAFGGIGFIDASDNFRSLTVGYSNSTRSVVCNMVAWNPDSTFSGTADETPCPSGSIIYGKIIWTGAAMQFWVSNTGDVNSYTMIRSDATFTPTRWGYYISSGTGATNQQATITMYSIKEN